MRTDSLPVTIFGSELQPWPGIERHGHIQPGFGGCNAVMLLTGRGGEGMALGPPGLDPVPRRWRRAPHRPGPAGRGQRHRPRSALGQGRNGGLAEGKAGPGATLISIVETRGNPAGRSWPAQRPSTPDRDRAPVTGPCIGARFRMRLIIGPGGGDQVLGLGAGIGAQAGSRSANWPRTDRSGCPSVPPASSVNAHILAPGRWMPRTGPGHPGKKAVAETTSE